MLVTILVMVVVGAMALALAALDRRHRRSAPTSTTGEPPSQLDRADFRSPDASWLIAVFTSDTCASCARVWTELSAYESTSIAVHNSEVSAEPAIHRRYAIDSVPTAVISGVDGLVHHAVVGPIGPHDRRRISAILAGDG